MIARQAQLLAYENNELDFVEVPSSDLKRIQNDPKLSKELILYDAPITWYCASPDRIQPLGHDPQVLEPA